MLGIFQSVATHLLQVEASVGDYQDICSPGRLHFCLIFLGNTRSDDFVCTLNTLDDFEFMLSGQRSVGLESGCFGRVRGGDWEIIATR